MAEERLQKILSRAGVASRRKAEELMAEGRVSVNGEIVTQLGTKADLDRDHIKVDGKLLRAPDQFTYIALNKPRGVMTTLSDPEGRPTIVDLLRRVKTRVYPVGRLDYNSEGLLILTNDGELANRIMSKARGVEKVYLAKLNAFLTPVQEEQFRNGVPLHGRKTSPAHLKMIKRAPSPWYEVRITEGRYHQVRDMFQHFGVLVEKLRRVKVGFLALDVEPGDWRHLTAREVERFRRLLKMEEEK